MQSTPLCHVHYTWIVGDAEANWDQPSLVTGSVASLWRSNFAVKLDAMHLMLRIGREMNAEHPRRRTFLTHLSVAILSQHEGDRQRLVEARKAAGLEGDPVRVGRMRFVRRIVGDPESVVERMTLVVKA